MPYRFGRRLQHRHAEAGILSALVLHGTLLVATDTIPSATEVWLMLVAVAGLPTFALLDHAAVRGGVSFRAASALTATVALMLTTGGASSCFLLWAFVVAMLYW